MYYEYILYIYFYIFVFVIYKLLDVYLVALLHSANTTVLSVWPK